MTFSIAGVCPDTGMVGCAITSSSICVASRCAFTRSGTGVALTQNITNPDLGPLALDLMAEGLNPTAIMAALAEADSNIQWRQLGVLNLAGEGITFSGTEALGLFANAEGKNCIAMGNLLENTGVPQAMIESFENSTGHLAERLLSALEAGLAAGGELGPVQSAGLQVCSEPEWPTVDLRVDWHIEPINELRMVWRNYQPQMDAYITRAKDPANAESYGVPGDE
ncbi:DUF1028 domain-containing protein [Neptunomonas qingdaonensis]|uniref:Uncharacterized conserved protein, Ntn-hydrolase superfamily n=1 Tax=Neptunomonas qingdaonensis TaxID=1045558 RepID=A0A1I2V4S6_9GAMM|nr:DUF1028 domain-containing protein [Neptunomonas qingdaonensis]SFG83207.1 Uncharacterized conserved protein, Ntn-hydrolase superfamily [Neptunomonas qingdaonensis]